MPTVALAGPKNSGKSTVARWLCTERGFVELSLADPLKTLSKKFFEGLFTDEDLYGPSVSRERLFSLQERLKAAHAVAVTTTALRSDHVLREEMKQLFPQHKDRELSDRFARVFADPETLKSPRTILQQLGTDWGRHVWDQVWLNQAKETVTKNPSTSYVIPDCRFANEVEYLKKELGASIYWVEGGARLGEKTDRHASEPDREALVKLCDVEIDNTKSVDALYAYLTLLFPTSP